MESAQIFGQAMTQSRETAGNWAEPAFRKVFLEHYPRIVGVLTRLLGDRSRAEEVANDSFLKLYRQPASIEIDGNVGGWLYRTATNLGIDRLRSATRRKQYEQAAARLREGESEPGPLEDVLRQEQCRRVRTALALIKPAQAQILILRASGLSYKELAEAMEVRPTSIGSMLNRAEAEFRMRYLQLAGLTEEL